MEARRFLSLCSTGRPGSPAPFMGAREPERRLSRPTRMAIGRAALVTGLTSIMFLVMVASPAAASCAPPQPLPEAVNTSDLVVVGTVTGTRSGGRIATVTVEDIWRGDADPQIEVAGGPDEPNRATSVDRTYVIGTRYLFFILVSAQHDGGGTFGARFEDNNCSDTRPYTADLDQLRPTTARPPVTSAPPPSSSTPRSPSTNSTGDAGVWLAGSLLAACAAMLALGWRAHHRRRQA